MMKCFVEENTLLCSGPATARRWLAQKAPGLFFHMKNKADFLLQG